MKRKLFLLQLCRIFLPRPKPSLQVLNAMFSQSSDARAFIIKLLNLESFDCLNQWVTRSFLRQSDSRLNVSGPPDQPQHLEDVKSAFANDVPRAQLAIKMFHQEQALRKRYILLLRQASSVLEELELMHRLRCYTGSTLQQKVDSTKVA